MKNINRRYKVSAKQLAIAIFNKNKAKYLLFYSSSSKAKEAIEEIINYTFKEIVDNVLEDRIVEIWGFGKFILSSHSRYFTNKIQVTFGNTIRQILKPQKKESLKQEVLERTHEISILEQEYELEKSKEVLKKLETKRAELEVMEKLLKFKSTSLNPKYRDDEDLDDEEEETK